MKNEEFPAERCSRPPTRYAASRRLSWIVGTALLFIKRLWCVQALAFFGELGDSAAVFLRPARLA